MAMSQFSGTIEGELGKAKRALYEAYGIAKDDGQVVTAERYYGLFEVVEKEFLAAKRDSEDKRRQMGLKTAPGCIRHA